MLDISRSQELLKRATRVIPSATQTFSKGPNQWIRGLSPHYLVRGEGAWVWDADGNKYLDYLMALGPIILGYGNRRVNEAAMRQIADGTVFSQMHPLEVEVAEKLVDIVPCAEMVRFGKNGSDVTTGAVRAARAYTGRDHVAYCGYHGWHDWYIGTTTRNKGVPAAVSALSHSFAYNDLASLESLFDQFPSQVAAVIMEPMGVEPPRPGYLDAVRNSCRRNGTVLIFDEIITGFRYDLRGAQGYFGVTPDLACFGKAMANGFPLAAVVGQRDLMMIFDEIFFSGTFGGEASSLAACKATIDEMQEHDVIGHNWRVGRQLNEKLSELIAQHGLNDVVRIVGFPVRSVMTFPGCDEDEARLRRSFVMQECVKRGLLYFASNNPCFAHNEPEIRFTLDVFAEVLPLVAAAFQANDFAARMEGLVVEPIFRRA
ncbi:MAG: aminotransferase class III-fold pyridoxal phosphate-dependent enzyme [Hyphomicrobiales bacterium]|nr:aminotransferase class III-fold pyridoxal phosphate-dependent enzyme [Hyphomicrobiales bacterium]